MKTKKIISMLLTACISLSTMAGLCTTASAETTGETENVWKTVYSNEVTSQVCPTSVDIKFYEGNLNDGGKYKITVKEHVYGQPNGNQMYVYSGDNFVHTWNKTSNSTDYELQGGTDGATWTAVTGNVEYNLTAVLYADLTTKSLEYTLSSDKVDTTASGKVTLKGDKITSIVFHQYGIDTWSYPTSWSIKIEKQVEVVNKSIYSGSGFTILDPENENGGVKLSLYSGERLSGANGEKYTIIYEGKSYTGVSGYFFKLCDGETSADLWFKGGDNGYKNSYDSTAENGKNIQINCGTANPFNVKAVIDVDFSGTTPKAAVKVYDHDLATVLVDKTVDLTGFTGITDVLYTPWSTDVSGAMHYERPVDAKLTIKKESVLTWENIYTNEVKDQTQPTEYALKFYDGNLNDGGLYKITLKETLYGQPLPHQLYVYSGNDFVHTWTKDNGSRWYKLNGGVSGEEWEAVTQNEVYNLATVFYADLTEHSLSYTMSSDKVNTTASGKVKLKGNSITSIVYKQTGGIDTWSYPTSWSIKIEKANTAGDNTQDIELKSAKLESGSVKVDLTINAVDKAVPYAIIAAFYNGNLLVKTQIKSGTVTIGEKKESESFGQPSADYDKAYIYLWDGMSTLKPYDAPVQVSLN